MHNQSLPNISNFYKTTIIIPSLIHRIGSIPLTYDSDYLYLVYLHLTHNKLARHLLWLPCNVSANLLFYSPIYPNNIIVEH